MKRLLLATVSTVAAVLLATPAVAARPEPLHPDDNPGLVPAGYLCPFAVDIQASGRAKTVEHPGGDLIELAVQQVVTITNTGSGDEVTYSINGTFRSRTLPNGDVRTTMTGRNVVGDPEAGFVLITGRFFFTADAEENIVEPLNGHGRVVDICEVLS